jgi:hypothetical protein
MYGFYLSYFFTSYSEIVLYLRTTAKVNFFVRGYIALIIFIFMNLCHSIFNSTVYFKFKNKNAVFSFYYSIYPITVFCGTQNTLITVFCSTLSPCSVAHRTHSSPCSVAHHHRVLWHTEHTITVFCGTQNTLRVIFSKNDILRCTPTLHIFLLHIQKWFYLYEPPLKGKFLC